MLNSATSTLVDPTLPVWMLTLSEDNQLDISVRCNQVLDGIKKNCWKPFKEATRVTIWTPVMNAQGPLQKLGALVSVLAREVFTLGICGYWAQRRDAIEGILKKFRDQYLYQHVNQSSEEDPWYVKGFPELGQDSASFVECPISKLDFNTLVTQVLHKGTIGECARKAKEMANLTTYSRLSFLACLASYALFRASIAPTASIFLTVFGGVLSYAMMIPSFSVLFVSLCLLVEEYFKPQALPDRPLSPEEMQKGPLHVAQTRVPYLQFFEASNFANNVPPAL